VKSLPALTRLGWMPAAVAMMAAVCLAEVALRPELTADGPAPLVALAALWCLVLPLLAWRRLPFAIPVAVWIWAAILSFVAERLVIGSFGAYLAGITAAFLLGSLKDSRKARIGLVVVVVCSVLVVRGDTALAPTSLIFFPAFFSLAWFVGLTARTRVEQAEAAEQRAVLAELTRESEARTAVAEERARIARELHDVVAHSLSVMVLMVGAVRQRIPADRGDDREALREVEDVGRRALGDMRRLLGAVSGDDGVAKRTPQPTLDDLPALVEQLQRAGLDVTLSIEPSPAALAPAVALSVYRIVQEGLTNVVKHAQASRAEVSIDYEAGDLVVAIRDDGMGPGDSDGKGRGLLGIAERVKILGGSIQAEAAADGGFALIARIPVGAGER
jgi:signal transduction histidine kinase